MPENSPAEIPKITVTHKRGDVIENTLGRLGSITGNLVLATPSSIIENPSQTLVQELPERLKNVSWKGNVEVYLGHSPLFRQLKRLFQKERRTNLFARIAIGLPTTITGWLSGKLARADAYNPFTETAQIYHNNKAVAYHELGHAEDFDKRKYPSLYAMSRLIPGIALLQEWRASRNAMKHLTKEERPSAANVLEPAFGTYVGSELLPFVLRTPFTSWLPLIGALVGHIHARTANKNIFFNEAWSKEAIASASQPLPALVPARI